MAVVLRARPEEPTQPVTLRTGHHVHVEVQHALAHAVVHRDEGPVRGEPGLDQLIYRPVGAEGRSKLMELGERITQRLQGLDVNDMKALTDALGRMVAALDASSTDASASLPRRQRFGSVCGSQFAGWRCSCIDATFTPAYVVSVAHARAPTPAASRASTRARVTRRRGRSPARAAARSSATK